MLTLDDFLGRVKARDTPLNPMARIEVFSRELAEGAAELLWPTEFDVFGVFHEGRRENDTPAKAIYEYIIVRFESLEAAPSFQLLERNGYLTAGEQSRFAQIYTLTKASFALLDRTEPARLFISYKCSESSAFALLIRNTLRQYGLAPFLDLQLVAGSDWREELRSRVKAADYLILLMAPKTLHSQVTLEEIQWALDSGTTIVPVWHGGFAFKGDEWPSVPEHVRAALAGTHTIRVLEENPISYDSAIRAILNRFGVAS